MLKFCSLLLLGRFCDILHLPLQLAKQVPCRKLTIKQGYSCTCSSEEIILDTNLQKKKPSKCQYYKQIEAGLLVAKQGD